MCSDGSPAAYYRSKINPAASAPDNYVIFLEGGGYCHDVNACDWRCNMAPHLCTTPTAETLENSGILSDDPHINPHFYGYFKVDLPYCTSDMYIGRRSASILTKGHHFRGRTVLTSMIKSLVSNTPISLAKRIILGGSSAGGAGVAFNCDYLKELLPRSDVHCVVDAAFFYPLIQPFQDDVPCESIDKVLKVGGVLWGAPEALNLSLRRWWSNIRQKLFIGIARFDQFGLESFCGNETSQRDLDIWGRGVASMARELERGYPNVGLFMPGCIRHMMLNDNKAFSGLPTGHKHVTYGDALRNWVQGSGDIHVRDACIGHQSDCRTYC